MERDVELLVTGSALCQSLIGQGMWGVLSEQLGVSEELKQGSILTPRVVWGCCMGGQQTGAGLESGLGLSSTASADQGGNSRGSCGLGYLAARTEAPPRACPSLL